MTARADRWTLLAVAALAGGPGPRALASPPPPLAWQEPSPVARLFLQLPFEAPEPAPPGRLAVDATVRYSNSLLLAASSSLVLETDVESAAPSLLLRAGLLPGLEGQLQLAWVADGGGVLDRPIEAVEGIFGATNPQRSGRPRDTATWALVRPGGRGLVRRGPEAGPADPWLGIKLALLTGAGLRPALSLRAALALPVSRPPFGAGLLVPAAGVLAGWSVGRAAVRLAADLAVPAGRLAPLGLATRPYLTVQAGAALAVSDRVALQLQGSGHGAPFASTGLQQLDRPTFYVLAGVTAAAGRALALDFGLVENVFSPYRGADVGVLLALRTRP